MKIYTGINMANNLEAALNTSVKFYASLTRRQATGLDSIGTDSLNEPIYVEPGAVCFISDELGNSIILNKRLFTGSGSSGGGGGAVDAVNGKTGYVLLDLSDFSVVQSKTLANYFDLNGNITLTGKDLNNVSHTLIIYPNKITIDGLELATTNYVDTVLNTIVTESRVLQAIQEAKNYTDSKIISAYTPKGSVLDYDDLQNISSPKTGWVYNVVSAKGTLGLEGYIAPGTNYVFIEDESSLNNQGGYWDALGGTIDMSAYKTAANTTEEIAAGVSEAKSHATQIGRDLLSSITANSNAIQSLNGLSNTVNNHTTNITQISTQLTWQ